MSEPRSVLFGTPVPDPATLTAGQSWTAALAVGLAALLLALGGGSTSVAPANGSRGAPSPGERVATATNAPQDATVDPPVVPATPFAPSFEPAVEPEPALGPTPPPDDAPAPENAPPPPADGGGPPPPDPPPPQDGEEPPPLCETAAEPVLTEAHLCPRSPSATTTATRSRPRRGTPRPT